MSWQKAIILNTNEHVLHSWDGDCERRSKQVFKEEGLIRDRYVSKEAEEVYELLEHWFLQIKGYYGWNEEECYLRLTVLPLE